MDLDQIYHAHAAGLIGGFAVCGSIQGFVTNNDERINCLECLRRIVKQNYNPTKRQQNILKRDTSR